MVTREGSRPAGAEQRLKELGIKLPAPPEPFGTYVEAVQTGNLLFLTGMLPTEGHGAKFVGRVGAELDVEAGRKAAHLAALLGDMKATVTAADGTSYPFQCTQIADGSRTIGVNAPVEFAVVPGQLGLDAVRQSEKK